MIGFSPQSKIKQADRLMENIFSDTEMYSRGSLNLKNLGEVMKKMYELEPDKVLDEITNNVRYIGNNVFGISKDMVFSVTTENDIESSKKKEEVDR